MAETKITKRMNYNEIISILEREEIARKDLADVIRHEIELMDNKNAKKKDSKATIEKRNANKELAENLYELMTDVKSFASISELKTLATDFATLSSSKMSVLLGILIDNGKVEKIYEKRTPMFKVID